VACLLQVFSSFSSFWTSSTSDFLDKVVDSIKGAAHSIDDGLTFVSDGVDDFVAAIAQPTAQHSQGHLRADAVRTADHSLVRPDVSNVGPGPRGLDEYCLNNVDQV
jgi:hypothetical protein